MKLTIRSWQLARWLGVKDKPLGDVEFMAVRVKDVGEYPLWWPIDVKLRKELV
jgi:hypothetical protein